VNDKYFAFCLSNCFDNNDEEFNMFLAQVHYLESLDILSCDNFKGVKGRLAKHIDFWVNIGASDFVIDTIKKMAMLFPFWIPRVVYF